MAAVSAADPLNLDARKVQEQLDELLWYHTIEVVPGAVTKGWWDLRHAVPHLPFPDIQGKRCLDVGTWDGFYAFELERRGAAEVVAVDLADMRDIDWPPEVRARPEANPTLDVFDERSSATAAWWVLPPDSRESAVAAPSAARPQAAATATRAPIMRCDGRCTTRRPARSGAGREGRRA